MSRGTLGGAGTAFLTAVAKVNESSQSMSYKKIAWSRSKFATLPPVSIMGEYHSLLSYMGSMLVQRGNNDRIAPFDIMVERNKVIVDWYVIRRQKELEEAEVMGL
jgi:hypothetical protein